MAVNDGGPSRPSKRDKRKKTAPKTTGGQKVTVHKGRTTPITTVEPKESKWGYFDVYAQSQRIAPFSDGTHVNKIDKGYGVKLPDNTGALLKTNAYFVNQLGQRFNFFVEEIEANTEMVGITAQSHKMRQFFPRQMAQPSITVRGRNRDSYQENMMSAFVRTAQRFSLSGKTFRMAQAAGVGLRYRTMGYQSKSGDSIYRPTVKLVIGNGTKTFPYNGRNVAGRHGAVTFEGYIANMPAGSKRHNPAPPYEFTFLIAEATGSFDDSDKRGLWHDSGLVGSEILSWMEYFGERTINSFVVESDNEPGAPKKPEATKPTSNRPGKPNRPKKPKRDDGNPRRPSNNPMRGRAR